MPRAWVEIATRPIESGSSKASTHPVSRGRKPALISPTPSRMLPIELSRSAGIVIPRKTMSRFATQ